MINLSMSLGGSRAAGGGPPAVQLWTPAIASPAMRYDPAAPAGTTRSGTSVMTLHDLSGGYGLTQSTGSMQPQTGRAIGGRSVLDFDGGDLLARTTGLPSPGPGDSMVAMVADFDSLAGSPFRGREGTGTRWGFLISSGNLTFVHNNAFAGAGATATTGPQIIVGYRSGSTTYLRRNGTQIATGPAGTCPALSAIEIGNALDGAVGEAIPTLSYSDGLRDRLEGYLAHAYGLAALLPADHPYKSTPPQVTQ